MLKKLFLFSTVGVLIFSFTSLAMCQEKDTIPKVLIEVRTLLRQARQQQDPVLYEEAVEKLQELIKENPNCFEAYITLAEAYEKQNKIDLAGSTHEKLLNLNPQDSMIYLRVINFYLMHNMFNEAEPLAEKCISKFPENSLIFKKSLLTAYMGQGKIDKARKFINSDEDLKSDKSTAVVKKALNFTSDPQITRIKLSILDKVNFIGEKVKNNSEKYSCLLDKTETIFDGINIDEENLQSLKKIDDGLQKIIDDIK